MASIPEQGEIFARQLKDAARRQLEQRTATRSIGSSQTAPEQFRRALESVFSNVTHLVDAKTGHPLSKRDKSDVFGAIDESLNVPRGTIEDLYERSLQQTIDYQKQVMLLYQQTQNAK